MDEHLSEASPAAPESKCRGALSALRAQLESEHQEKIQNKNTEIAVLRQQLARAEKKIALLEEELRSLQNYAREREIEQIMRTMTYEELCEIEAKRATGEDVPDTYLEAARRVQADRERLIEVLNLPRLKAGDSLCRTAMPGREDVARGIDVAVGCSTRKKPPPMGRLGIVVSFDDAARERKRFFFFDAIPRYKQQRRSRIHARLVASARAVQLLVV